MISGTYLNKINAKQKITLVIGVWVLFILCFGCSDGNGRLIRGGLKPSEVIVKINGKQSDLFEFKQGDVLEVVFKNVKGLSREDGKIELMERISIIDQKTDMILNDRENLYKTDKKKVDIHSYYVFNKDNVPGEYIMEFSFFDEIDFLNDFKYRIPVKVE